MDETSNNNLNSIKSLLPLKGRFRSFSAAASVAARLWMQMKTNHRGAYSDRKKNEIEWNKIKAETCGFRFSDFSSVEFSSCYFCRCVRIFSQPATSNITRCIQVSRRCRRMRRCSRRKMYHRATGPPALSFLSAASSHWESVTQDNSVSVPTPWPRRRPHRCRCYATLFKWPSEGCTRYASTPMAR